jgi:tRNA-splicing ligase RtcB
MQERTTAKMVIPSENGSRPIKVWTTDVEDEAMTQLKNLSRLPFIAKEGVACMPDVHAGKGSTVGTVIATDKAIIPAAVGVDIGCGMVATRLSLKAHQLPDSLARIRSEIERVVPMGTGGNHTAKTGLMNENGSRMGPYGWLVHSLRNNDAVSKVFGGDAGKAGEKAWSQVGTLGSGNHFIEICIDQNDDVWVMLHSGSRGIGNMIGQYYIDKGKELMEQFHITLPDGDLAYLPQGTDLFEDYVAAVQWAQDYAMENRKWMLKAVLDVLRREIPVTFGITEEAINCHHNYVVQENHFGKNLWITRKGAIRAREGDLGIIPGSMGAKSYIVRGKGNKESYCSCSHGAGRKMSRSKARQMFTVADLKAQTQGVECRKDDAVLDEIPGSYKDIDVVMENQKSLVEVVHTLRAVLCCKGA